MFSEETRLRILKLLDEKIVTIKKELTNVFGITEKTLMALKNLRVEVLTG